MTDNRLHCDELPYRPDSSSLFRRLRERPAAVWLDSCFDTAHGGRFDLLAADPVADGPAPLGAGANASNCGHYFDELKRFCGERYRGIQGLDADLPFCGGLLGYIGYEAGLGLNHVASALPAEVDGPALARVQAYDWCIVQDHLLRRSLLVSLPTLGSGQRQDLLACARASDHEPPGADFQLNAPFRSSLGEKDYAAAFDRIAAYIQAGDCYQVNLAQCFSSGFDGDPLAAYLLLRSVAGGPFSGFMEWQDGGLLCLSPERFISLQGRHVETRPIKGTRPRHLQNAAIDRALALALRDSPKDRAENLMIVDLLRNDLGRNCALGSIHVEQLFEVESYPAVHHLVSTISGELAPGRSAIDLLRDSFPGGSITGAPKQRAMEIISELEPARREAYCGSLLYISADGRMDSNIAIRSLLLHRGELRCWAGGGIVADSSCDEEYQETFDKVGGLLRALETAGLHAG